MLWWESTRKQKTVLVTEIPKICIPLHRKQIPNKILESLGKISLAEDYTRDTKLDIDILIGLDQYWNFVDPQGVPVTQGLVAQRTAFGWMISGTHTSREEGSPPQEFQHSSLTLFCINGVRDDELRRMWDMDLEPAIDEHCPLKQFDESIRFRDGRYEVALPWKPYSGELQDNLSLAKLRMQSLLRKLDRDEKLKADYYKAFRDMEKEGVIEEVPAEEIETTNSTFYMPHRPVVKESSATTKVRPVFDASAKGRNGVSLNDCMETGPNLIPSIVDILIRFRRWPIALAADIQKAFLQISVRPEDRDVHRFLWQDGDSLRIMRFTRVPFGNRCSPFLLNATVKYHLKQAAESRVVTELQENLYVDDWLTGAEEESEASSMIVEADEIMKQAAMNLTKWGSNSKDVLDSTLYNLTNKTENLSDVKVLGLGWLPDKDCFVFQGMDIDEDLIVTKRIVLSFIARLFDPLGFLNPFIIRLKCLFQKLWKMELDWDHEVPLEVGRRARKWIEDLKLLKAWRVPRTYAEIQWTQKSRVVLHAFGDASPEAYGACV